MYLLIEAYPERPMCFVLTDDFGVDRPMEEMGRKQVMFTNFAHEVDKIVCEHGVSDIVLYGQRDYIGKLADYVREDFPAVNVRTVPARG